MWNFVGYELYPQFDRERLAVLLMGFRRVVVREQDKSLANRLEEELLGGDFPAIQTKTFLRLAKWCKTEGIYQDGMGVAREISLLLFGRILDREQLGA
jgi:hypothetical protein